MIRNGETKAKQAYYITFFKAWMAGWMVCGEIVSRIDMQVCTGALILQIIIGGSGDLRKEYPGLITLIGAFFFPVGLVSWLKIPS